MSPVIYFWIPMLRDPSVLGAVADVPVMASNGSG
jgi:hypothetical protein